MHYLVVLFIGLFVLPVQASVNIDVFNYEVVLDSNQADAESMAKTEAMKHVVIKASGNSNAITNPVIKKALNRTSSYLSQLGHGEINGQKTLQVGFNPEQIQLLLNQADLSYWSSSRANLLVWVVRDGEYGRQILWEHDEDESLSNIKSFSSSLGLPIVVPVGDIEDVSNITASDLWGGFTSSISTASQRYTSDAVLVIKIQQASNGEYIRWTLYDEKAQFIVDSKRQPIVGTASGNANDALRDIIDEISQYYAQKSAIKFSGKSKNTVLANFIGISSATRFFSLEKTLKSLNSVAGVDVEKIVGDEVMFTIHLLSSEEDFSTEVGQIPNIGKLAFPSQVEQPVTSPEMGESSEIPVSNMHTNINDENSPAQLSEPDANSERPDSANNNNQIDEAKAELPVIEKASVLTFEWIN
ncbi:DUF2066 domain-containing protein [Vibrio sp. TH_r3]|uniref:DUF2066 domain-containing protein n=1 Tax=Vibrio sp. TH_r3 TaxID=3082084 RepID=UPI0029544BD8|nr:DUF2066 domain-containing protein [Vibrio sp. TH_r3]MDV7105067.1 DUF2066 domain-containing protein [Vibrio sp. TH_r3]